MAEIDNRNKEVSHISTMQLSIQKCLLLLAPDRRDSVNSVRRLLSWIYIIERIMTKSCGYPNITPICDFFKTYHSKTLTVSALLRRLSSRFETWLPRFAPIQQQDYCAEARLAKFLLKVLDEVQVRDLCSQVFYTKLKGHLISLWTLLGTRSKRPYSPWIVFAQCSFGDNKDYRSINVSHRVFFLCSLVALN